MIRIGDFYDFAMLAESSYVDFGEFDYSDTVEVKKALQNSALHGTFSATQAADFVDQWEIISHQANTESGFSATLFKNKAGEYVYACRGTEPEDAEFYSDLLSTDLGDLVTDGLAIKQIVDMYNDWRYF